MKQGLPFLQPPATPCPLPVSVDLIYLFWTFPMNGIIHYVAFPVWLLALSGTFSRRMRAVARLSTCFLFGTEYCSRPVAYRQLLLRFLRWWTVRCCHLVALVSSAFV